MTRRRTKSRLKRCNITGLVILPTELDAKIVLAKRRRLDKGEVSYFPCMGHYHLSSYSAEGIDTP